MTLVKLVAVIVRLFAIWLVVTTVLGLPSINAFLSHENDATFRAIVFATSIATLIFCIFLWKFPVWVSGKIVPASVGDGETSFAPNDFLSVGILLIGIWTVMDALPYLVRQIFLLVSEDNADVVFGNDFYGYVYALAFKVLMGIWLILGAPGFRSMLKWVRTAGVKY